MVKAIVSHAHFVDSPSRNVLALAASALFLCTFSSSAQDLNHKVSEYMHAQVEINHFRGSILIAQNDFVLVSKEYTQTSGMADKSERDNKYRLGSIAKPIIAAAILQLQEKGDLKVQDSICKYVTKCPSDWEQIKIFNLLTQTDGIPEAAFDTKTTIATPELLADLKARPLEFAPRERLRYGDSGYEVLGAIVEKVSGEPYLRYVKEHIFLPLGMRETDYHGARQISVEADRGPNREIESITRNDIRSTIPYSFGTLYSTAEDLYRWDHALHGETLLSKESRAAMFTPYVDGYGFGWAVFREFGRRVDTNAGGIDLFPSAIRDYPDDHVCVIVLSSTDNSDGGRMSRDLAAMLFGMHYELPVVRHAISLDPAIYDSYVGRYELASGSFLVVSKEANRLRIRGPDQPEVEIVPETQTRFFAKGLDAVVNFVRGPNGKTIQLVLQQGGRDIPAEKK